MFTFKSVLWQTGYINVPGGIIFFLFLLNVEGLGFFSLNLFSSREEGLHPGVKVEGEGGVEVEREGDCLLHAGQRLAEVQALCHKSRFTSISCSRRHPHSLE